MIMRYAIFYLFLASFLFQGCSPATGNTASASETPASQSASAMENSASNVGNDAFINFIAAFQDERPPFDLSNLPNAGEIDSAWVVRYIDPNFPNVIATEKQEAEEKDGGESYFHLSYYHSARVVISPDFYTVVFYQVREGIGPNGLLTVANYDLDGKIVGRVDLDVVEVYLEQKVKAVIEQDGVSVYGEEDRFFEFGEDGGIKS